jgi:hypothetical protein
MSAMSRAAASVDGLRGLSRAETVTGTKGPGDGRGTTI